MKFSVQNCFCAVVGVLVIMVQLISAHTHQPRFYRSTNDDGVEQVVEIIPSAVTVKPRPRQKIRSEFAKQYWVSGNFFNRDNFKAVHTLNSANDGSTASASIPRPIIFRGNVVAPVLETFQEL